ncbi:MAG: SCO family protein [Chloroflexi bacterium]|nr:SCO family protein [Chloroflexota bacterium]
MKSKRKSESFARLLYGMIAGLLTGIAALTIYLAQDQLREPEAADSGHSSDVDKHRFDGAIRIAPPIDVPDFTLSNQDGQTFELSDLRGRHILLTFGFTNCPDICPLTLSDFQQVKDMLGDRAEEVAFVFISVDGRRDSPAVLRGYFEYRQLDGIIALTGSEEMVRAIGAPMGLSFEVSGDASAGAYTVNHTAGSFLLDASGRWIMRYQFGLPPDRIAVELRTLLKD